MSLDGYWWRNTDVSINDQLTFLIFFLFDVQNTRDLGFLPSTHHCFFFFVWKCSCFYVLTQRRVSICQGGRDFISTLGKKETVTLPFGHGPV